MFSGIITKKLSAVRIAAVTGAVVLLVSTILEMQGINFFNFNTRNMLVADNFSLLFMAVMFAAVVLYYLLSGKDIEKVGSDVSEYYSLIFFVLAGVALLLHLIRCCYCFLVSKSLLFRYIFLLDPTGVILKATRLPLNIF